MTSAMHSWIPRSVSAVIATGGLLLLSGLSLAACSTSDSGSEAESDSDTIPIAVPFDGGPDSDTDRKLERIAKQLNSGTGPAMESTSGVLDLIVARRFEDFAVEVVYRYAEPVDAEISAALILSRLDTPEAYMESEFFPIVDGLNIPDTYLAFSYFQPDGEHIISILCQYVTWEAGEGSWRPDGGHESAGSAGACNESPTLTEGYASGRFVAP